jgi:hypothetical protein
MNGIAPEKAEFFISHYQVNGYAPEYVSLRISTGKPSEIL